MSIPQATFLRPHESIARTTITPRLSSAHRAALARLGQAREGQQQLQGEIAARFEEAQRLTGFALVLGEQARRRQREALLGDVHAAVDQLSAREEQQRAQIANDFALYSSEAAMHSVGRGISPAGTGAAAQAIAQSQASQASAVARANRAAAEQQVVRSAAFQAEAADFAFMQDVIGAIGDLSALRFEARASIRQAQSREQELGFEQAAQRRLFLDSNLQEGIGQFQQSLMQMPSGSIFDRLTARFQSIGSLGAFGSTPSGANTNAPT